MVVGWQFDAEPVQQWHQINRQTPMGNDRYGVTYTYPRCGQQHRIGLNPRLLRYTHLYIEQISKFEILSKFTHIHYTIHAFGKYALCEPFHSILRYKLYGISAYHYRLPARLVCNSNIKVNPSPTPLVSQLGRNHPHYTPKTPQTPPSGEHKHLAEWSNPTY